MAPTYAKSNLNLAIEVERGAHLPGDTVVGTIHRRNAMVCPSATVDLVFLGRTKSKMVVRRNNNSHTYRGRFTLLKSSQRVFQGPVHIPEGNQEPHQWPFAVPIPTNIDSRLFPQQYNAEESYLPIDSASVSRMPLPASFSSGYGRREGFIEYYLEATIRYQRKGSWSMETAVVPIKILTPNPNPPIANFNLFRWAYSQSVSSQRLVPGMKDAELSKTDKMKKFFGSSSVPRFAFKLEVAAPKTLQINHYPIPFSMRVNPLWSGTTELIQNVPQKAKLVTFRATLESYCEIRCEGFFSPHEADWTDKLDLQSHGFGDRPLAIEIPCAIGDAAPADIGSAIMLRLPTNSFQGFTTFNVRLGHRLSWRIKCEIAGESFTTRGSQDVTIIPASNGAFGGQGESVPQSLPLNEQRTESWMVPPDEAAPPPSFAEVQREDKKEALSRQGEDTGGSSKAEIMTIEGQDNVNDAAFLKEKS